MQREISEYRMESGFSEPEICLLNILNVRADERAKLGRLLCFASFVPLVQDEQQMQHKHQHSTWIGFLENRIGKRYTARVALSEIPWNQRHLSKITWTSCGWLHAVSLLLNTYLSTLATHTPTDAHRIDSDDDGQIVLIGGVWEGEITE